MHLIMGLSFLTYIHWPRSWQLMVHQSRKLRSSHDFLLIMNLHTDHVRSSSICRGLNTIRASLEMHSFNIDSFRSLIFRRSSLGIWKSKILPLFIILILHNLLFSGLLEFWNIVHGNFHLLLILDLIIIALILRW